MTILFTVITISQATKPGCQPENLPRLEVGKDLPTASPSVSSLGLTPSSRPACDSAQLPAWRDVVPGVPGAFAASPIRTGEV